MPQTPNRGAPSFAALLTVCCLVTFGCYFAVSMRLPVVPLYARGFGVTTAQIGAINAAFYLVAGLLSLPSGWLSDLFGRRRLAIAGALVLALGMLLLTTGRSFWPLAGLYLLLGIGTAAFGPTMMAWVAEVTPPTHLGRAYGWYTTALFCGLGMGPAAGGALARWLTAPPVFVIAAVCVVFTAAAVYRFLPARAHGETDRQEDSVPWRQGLGRIVTNRPLMGCWAATLGACFVGGVFFTFLPLHAADQGLDVGQIGLVFLAQSVSNALSRIPFGAFSDRVGHRKHQALAGLILLTLTMGGFAPASSLWQFLLAGLLFGVSNAVAFTAVGALIAETVSSRYRGLAMGGYNSCIYFGLMAGSIGPGPLLETLGFARGFLLAAGIGLPTVAFFAWAVRGYGAPRNAQQPAGDRRAD